MFEIITQVKQADGTIHATKTEVADQAELLKVKNAQQVEAGKNLISQEVY